VKITTTEAAKWQDGKLVLTIPETDEIRGRRYRAKQVVSDYPHQVTDDGVLFNTKLQTQLLPDKVGCVCQDMKNRQLPCKHVFAAASILGDLSALLDEFTQAVARSASEPHRKRSRLRPQDIRAGRFFLLSDFLFSDTALKEGLPNWFDFNSDYGHGIIACMNVLCDRLLDPLCDEFGRISITRGYLGEQVYARLYPRDRANWVKGALAHGFQETGGADICIHAWQGDALSLAKHIQSKSDCYQFDFIRTYPESSILCVGVGRFKNSRIITEWHNNFAGSTTHRP
jgi:hypothetical protein